MKQDIHPKFYTDTKVECVCGNTFTSGSTQQVIKVDICSQCHPFFTGTQKLIDTEGRVDKFAKRQAAAANFAQTKKQKDDKKAAKKNSNPKSLKEMLQTEE